VKEIPAGLVVFPPSLIELSLEGTVDSNPPADNIKLKVSGDAVFEITPAGDGPEAVFAAA
jgi:hypothetical protein